MDNLFAAFVKGQPVIFGIILLYIAIKAIIDMYKKIIELKSVEDAKLLRLLKIKENLNPKDGVLSKFLDERIIEEIFIQSSGLDRSYERNVKLIQFYNENTSVINWKELRRVAQKFKFENGKLTFTKRNLMYKLGTIVTYLFFGLVGLISWLSIIYGIQKHVVSIGLTLALLILFLISTCMIGLRMNGIYLRKKFEDMNIQFEG